MMFAKTLDASGRLPEVRTRRGRSLALYSRSRKAVALASVEYLPIQQCGRSLLAVLIQNGRGERCRSWFKDEEIAALMPRSGGKSYSRTHVRRWRRILELVGLVRSKYVAPGERFPSGTAPDVDGGGFSTRVGGNVTEVNMDAVLRLAPVWQGAAPSLGWQDAREARDAAAELRAELEAEGDGDAAEELAEALQEVAAGAVEVAGKGSTHGHPRVTMHGHSSTDLGSLSSRENYLDPGHATSTPREVALAGSETHADAGSPEAWGEPPKAPEPASPPERVASETPPAEDAAGSAHRAEDPPSEREARGEGEHGPGQPHGEPPAPATPREPPARSWPGRLPPPTRSPELERATTRPMPPVTVEQMRLDIASILGPQGRHGERVPEPWYRLRGRR